MGKQRYRKPIHQVVDAAKDAVLKGKENEDDAKGKIKPINEEGKSQGKRAKGNRNNKVAKNHRKGSNMITAKKAEEMANNGKFVYVDIKTNLILAIILSTLLSKTMTSVDAIMQKKKVPAFYRKRLKDLVLDHTGIPIEPKTVLIKPLLPPTLPLDKMVNVNVKGQDLDDADKVALINDLEAKHRIDESARMTAHDASEASRRAAHDAAEDERKRLYHQRLGEEYEQHLIDVANANASKGRSKQAQSPAPQFLPTPYSPGQNFTPTPFVPIQFVPPEIKPTSFKVVNANGQFYKVAVPQIQEVRMPLFQALPGLESKAYSSLEAEAIFKRHAKDLSEYNKMIKNQETDEDNYLNTLWTSLSEESKVAMAAMLPGGKLN